MIPSGGNVRFKEYGRPCKGRVLASAPPMFPCPLPRYRGASLFRTSFQNPPDGAVINYYLKAKASGPITLEILDAAGQLVRKYSTDDPVEPLKDEGNVPAYWIRPTIVLSNEAGMHRFVWDLHYSRPQGMQAAFPIAAVYRNTARAPHGVWAQPGQYTARLTVDGKTLTQPLVLKMDPRVKTPREGLRAQFDRSKDVTADMARTLEALRVVRVEQGQAKAMSAARIKELADRETTLADLNAKLTSLYTTLQEADMAPTAAMVDAAAELRQQVTEALVSKTK